MRGWGRIKRLGRRLVLAPQSRAVVLLYHRVAAPRFDPQLLSVRPQYFDAHIEHLRTHYNVIRLCDLGRAIQSGHVPHRSVVVTFDDGYADNLWNAAPVLERHGVPATVFVTAGYVDQQREFWWDELERALLVPIELRGPLTVDIQDRRHVWDFDGGSPAAEGWNVLSQQPWSPRQRCYAEMMQLLLPLDDATRASVLRAVLEWSSAPAARAEYRPLRREELTALHRTDVVEIGAHTVTHPVLAAQSIVEQQREIKGSKSSLEAMIAGPVTTFSYPYGGRPEVSVHTVSTTRAAGFELACANVPHVVTRAADPFFLPRFMVRDWQPAVFARRLTEMFHE